MTRLLVVPLVGKVAPYLLPITTARCNAPQPVSIVLIRASLWAGLGWAGLGWNTGTQSEHFYRSSAQGQDHAVLTTTITPPSAPKLVSQFLG